MSFFNLKKKRVKYIFHDENNNYSCNNAKAHMMQCKHMISFNKLFNMKTIGKYWLKKEIELFNHAILVHT